MMSGCRAATEKLQTLFLCDLNFFAYVKNNQHTPTLLKNYGEDNVTDFLPFSVLSSELSFSIILVLTQVFWGF